MIKDKKSLTNNLMTQKKHSLNMQPTIVTILSKLNKEEEIIHYMMVVILSSMVEALSMEVLLNNKINKNSNNQLLNSNNRNRLMEYNKRQVKQTIKPSRPLKKNLLFNKKLLQIMVKKKKKIKLLYNNLQKRNTKLFS